jgi:hypothetical protein
MNRRSKLGLLDSLHRVARWMRPAAPIIALVGLALFTLCAGLLLFAQAEAPDKILLPAIVGVLWCLCGYVFIHAFAEVPAPPGAELEGWPRLKRQLARAWHWLLAVSYVGITLWALLITNHVIGEALS